jgi:hypothetical protein
MCAREGYLKGLASQEGRKAGKYIARGRALYERGVISRAKRLAAVSILFLEEEPRALLPSLA